MKRSLAIGGLGLVLALIFTAGPASAQRFNFHGHAFGDYFWVTNSHLDDIEGNNAFQFRQIYLTMDFDLGNSWSARLRHEMSSSGDFISSEKLDPGFEDAYLKWANDRHEMTFGLTETPTWGGVEPVWGYRAVEKTLVDLHGLGSSRDIGVTFKGSLDAAKTLRYHAMVANGNAAKSETDQGKKVFLSLGYFPTESLVFEVYGDYNDRPGDTNWYTLQGFLAYRGTGGRIGLQYVYQMRHVEEGPAVEINGLSVFGALALTRKVNGFLRFDRLFDPNPDGAGIPYIPFDPTAKSSLFIGGLEFQPHEQVHVMPNVEVVVYDAVDGVRPGTDVIPRLSFYFTF